MAEQVALRLAPGDDLRRPPPVQEGLRRGRAVAGVQVSAQTSICCSDGV